MKKTARSAPSARPPTDGPRSLARLLGLFDAVAGAADGLTLARLSQVLGAPKSSLLMLLRPLVKSDYLLHAEARYRLGPAAFRLASTIQATRSFPRLMRPYLERLVQASGESAYLAVLDADLGSFQYIDGIESPRPVRYWVPVGSRRPIYTGAAGKMLLAHQSEEWRERFLRSATLKAVASNTITSKAALRRELETIRQQGYALSRSEAVEDAAGVSVPVFNHEDGSIAGALLIAAPLERFNRELPSLRKTIVEVAAHAAGNSR